MMRERFIEGIAALCLAAGAILAFGCASLWQDAAPGVAVEEIDRLGRQFSQVAKDVRALCFEFDAFVNDLMLRADAGDSTYWHYQSGIETLELMLDPLCEGLETDV